MHADGIIDELIPQPSWPKRFVYAQIVPPDFNQPVFENVMIGEGTKPRRQNPTSGATHFSLVRFLPTEQSSADTNSQ